MTSKLKWKYFKITLLLFEIYICIIGTSHEIQIPFNEPQQQFDSGHGKYYCIHTQVKKYNSENE
jgi:hypothetical protein